MKKLLLTLFLIPNLVMAGECYVNTEVEEKFFGMKYTSEINKLLNRTMCEGLETMLD